MAVFVFGAALVQQFLLALLSQFRVFVTAIDPQKHAYNPAGSEPTYLTNSVLV